MLETGLTILCGAAIIGSAVLIIVNRRRKRRKHREELLQRVRKHRPPTNLGDIHRVRPRSPYTGKLISKHPQTSWHGISQAPRPVFKPIEDRPTSQPISVPDNSVMNGLAMGVLMDDLTRDQTPAPDLPVFGGGDFGGGGASDSWSGNDNNSGTIDTGSNFS